MIECPKCGEEMTTNSADLGEVDIKKDNGKFKLEMTGLCRRCETVLLIDVPVDDLAKNEGSFFFEVQCDPSWELVNVEVWDGQCE